MSKAILVIDDDKRLLDLIVDVLKNNLFDAVGVTEAAKARQLLNLKKFDAVVVDWMMPRETGIDFVKILRTQSTVLKKIPAIMLTALDDIDHKLEGFDAGFDDYITKPFEPKELIARLNSLIRRTEKENNLEKLLFGDCEFNLSTGELKKSGMQISITPTEQDLLKNLAQKPNEPFSRFELAKKLSFQVSDRAIDVQITRLRKKVGDDPKNPKIIKTVRYIGYMLCTNIV